MLEAVISYRGILVLFFIYAHKRFSYIWSDCLPRTKGVFYEAVVLNTATRKWILIFKHSVLNESHNKHSQSGVFQLLLPLLGLLVKALF